MNIQFYNTLSRKKEIFKPIKKGHVGIYTCGPTVYWYQHIGNMRSYIFSDILKRVLLFNNYKVNHIINVTDVGHLTSDADEGEDKLEKAARKEGKKASAVAKYYFDVFLKDLQSLNILSPVKWPKATDHIKEQVELIKKLEKKGYTYKTKDGIYFDSSKFKDYGRLANLNIKELKAGKRVSFGEKKHKTDFALWKFSSPEEKRQQEWDSPFGKGFPGWHIECSAMSMKYLGEHFDIHTGGQDHIPIHHTNEIAQSEAATGKKFSNYWLHGAFLLNNEGKKVSKSTGGLYTISELELQGYKPEYFRYLCLQTHYKKPLHFTLDALEASGNAYEKLIKSYLKIREGAEKVPHKGNTKYSSKYHIQFHEAINDDLNMPKALSVLWKLVQDGGVTYFTKMRLIDSFDEVLGLNIKNMKEEKFSIPKEVKELVKERETYRKEKQWEKADEIRKMIENKGFMIEDKSDGPILSKI